MAITITREILDEVRNLRLWHWREAMKARSYQSIAQTRAHSCAGDATYAARMQTLANDWDIQAHTHIKAVQTLNSFFPVDDTAELDESLRANPPTVEAPGGHAVNRNYIGQKDTQS